MKGLAAQVITSAQAMSAAQLNRGAAGNVSVRLPPSGQLPQGGFLITPTGMDYAGLVPEDIVAMDLAGESYGPRKPSSEWRFHRDIYVARPEFGAILHAHSLYCTSLACLERGIPAFHYMVAMAGGDSIRCTPYALFGSQELSDMAVAGLQDRSATLLGHHGMICYAASLEQVLALAIEVETLARIYLQALQVGEPPVLSAAAMAEVLKRFAAYKSV